jgi:geranylgeranylglycerol-phosphate geranylgeranyltransferase
VVLGEIIALGDAPPTPHVALGFMSSFLLTGSSFALNDYLDVDVDRVNRPDRPIPSGLVSARSTLRYGAVLAGMGLLAAAWLGLYPLVMAGLTFLLSVWYSARGKATGLLGNVTVAFCVAQPFPYGAIIATGSLDLTIVMVFLLTFLANAGREVANGIVDAAGDATQNVRSVAIVYGPRAAAVLASAFFLLTAITGPVVAWYGSGRLGGIHPGILPLIVAELGFVYSAVHLLLHPKRAAARKVAKQANVWMITVVIAFLVQHLLVR